MKRRSNNWYHRVTKNHKTVLQIVICQQIEQPRRKEQISRNIQPVKTESGRNRQSEHITTSENEFIIKKKIPSKESPASEGFTGEFYPKHKEALVLILLKKTEVNEH